MEIGAGLKELIQHAGIVPADSRQPSLPAPAQPAVSATEADHSQARRILLEQQARKAESKGVLKRVFKSSKEKEKEKEKSQDAILFSQDELDQALSSVVCSPSTGPGLIQAFLSLGAKVNFIDTPEKRNTSLRRRSTVLQQAASLRKADSVHLLASSGADQTTLDEGLKASLAANDPACIQELLRHGADLNLFPHALANAVRAGEQDQARLLLSAPKPLRPDLLSSCLAAAVQQKSESMVSLLVANGADPNFDSASALNAAIGMRDYRLAVALVAGPIPLTQPTLQRLLDTAMRLPTRQATLHFLQLLFCCGLSANSIGLPDLLLCAARHGDTAGAAMMIKHGVSVQAHDAECLMLAIEHSNWELVNVILTAPLTPQHASAALGVLLANHSPGERIRLLHDLVQKGATGPPLGQWLTKAASDGNDELAGFLLHAGAPLDTSAQGPLHIAVSSQHVALLTTLLHSRPPPAALAKTFPLLRTGFTPSLRREFARLLLEHGAQGPEVSQAVIDAVADTSPSRDNALIEELVHGGADVNSANGKALSLAVAQKDVALARLLCTAKPRTVSSSLALPLAFNSNGTRNACTAELIDVLLAHGCEEAPARETLQLAIHGGPSNMDIIQRLIAADAKLLTPAFEHTVALEDGKQKAPMLDALLQAGVTQQALDQALVTEVARAGASKDSRTTQMLLGQGASVSHNDGEALSVAVVSGGSWLISLLLSGKPQPSRCSLTRAFRALFADDTNSETSEQTTPETSEQHDIAQQLLERGVEQTAIDSALRSVLARDSEPQTESLVDLLLRFEANANVADGACFVFAAQNHGPAILDKLLRRQPNLAVVVPALLRSNLSDAAILASLDACFAHACTAHELQAARHGAHTPVLVLAMQHYPRNERLITLLLAHGLDPDIAMPTVLSPTAAAEPAPVLLWALAQPQNRVSDAVVLALVQAVASVDAASNLSNTTALMLAARAGRLHVTYALLERDADVNARDVTNRSALLYASSSGGEPIVRALAPRALRNDGSLHEAARELNVELARLLLDHRHDVNFPSRLHGGRNALGEACLHAQAATSSQQSQARQLLRLLLDHGADALFRACGEKSAVLLALDNPYSALALTDALLETEVWQSLHHDAHLFHDPATGFSYSPLSYVQLVPAPGRSSVQPALLALLRDKACTARFYADADDALQPPGATGLPAPIARRVEREKEHQLALKQAKESHEHTRTLEETLHRDTLRRRREAQDAERALEQQRHEAEMQRMRATEATRRTEKAAWHALAMEQERDAATKRHAAEERKVGAALAAEARRSEHRRAELEHRAALEKRMVKDKEDVYERNAARQKDVIRAADESAKLHAKLRQERPAIEGAPQWGTVD